MKNNFFRFLSPFIVILSYFYISLFLNNNDDNKRDELFGRSVAYQSGYLVVGAESKVVVFKKNGETFMETQNISGRIVDGYFSFGHTVAINHEYLVVGERQNSSATIFQLKENEWVQDSMITIHHNSFGHSVAISNEYIFVGDPEYDGDGKLGEGEYGGAVFVYKINNGTWTEFQKIRAKDRDRHDRFGWSIDAKDNKLIIGAYQDEDNGGWSGSAYVYQFDGSSWVEEQKIIASDGVEGDRFGYSVSIDINRLMVGALTASDNQAGAAYIFDYDGSKWQEQQKLTYPDSTKEANFGWSVDIQDNYAVAGAPYSSDEGILAGAAFIFRNVNDNWEPQEKLTPINGNYLDTFGEAVLLVDSLLMVGIPRELNGNLNIYKKNEKNFVLTQELLGELFVSNEDESEQITNFQLYQNYPNPFNPRTIISFQLNESDYVELNVYNSQGQLISTLLNDYKINGNYSIDFEGDNLPSGTYFYRLKTTNFTETKKMLLIK